MKKNIIVADISGSETMFN